MIHLEESPNFELETCFCTNYPIELQLLNNSCVSRTFSFYTTIYSLMKKGPMAFDY